MIHLNNSTPPQPKLVCRYCKKPATRVSKTAMNDNKFTLMCEAHNQRFAHGFGEDLGYQIQIIGEEKAVELSAS